MQRYLTLVVLFVLTIPVGLSIQGCANKNSQYCNGAGYGYMKSQTVSINLQPQVTGLSVAYSQITQLQTPTAENCLGTSTSVSSYSYGTTDNTIVDVSPTGSVCGGTWNQFTPGVAAYTTCIPTNKPGVAYLTAQAAGFTSNQVAVYSHPPIASLTLAAPSPTGTTTGTTTSTTPSTPACLSQGATEQLDATAACVSTGSVAGGACPSSTVPVGGLTTICSPSYTNTSTGPVYGANDCNNVIGDISYTASNASVVTIGPTGIATAVDPGSTAVTGSIAQTGSSAGYFYTCAPRSITLTNSSTGGTTASVTPNTPQPLTATVVDTNGNVVNGLPLTYVSTNLGSIGVSTTGSITATFPSSAAITAVCTPPTCNPAPLNLIGSLGTGAPVISNSVEVTSPGADSTYIWTASPSSPYFVPIDISTGTTGNPIKLPYTPNSMMMDPGGNDLYFGSYYELMIYNAATNTLAAQASTVPGVVLAVAPDNTSVVVNDQNRGVLYLYTPAATTTAGTPTAAGITSIAGIGERAAFTPDGQTVYIVGTNVLYIHNTYTGWSTEPLPVAQAGLPSTGVCPANNSSSYPYDPTSNPPDSSTNPNNTFNMFCSPDLAVTVPSAAVFLSGSQTSAYGICPETTVTPVVNYPEAATVGVSLDHLAATTDGKHIIGATATPPTLTDISINTPINACPPGGNGQTTGLTFTPAPTYLQAPLSSYGITSIDQVIASTNSTQAFVTYSSSATTPPAGGTLLPVYTPSTQPSTLGTLGSVPLAGSALAPVSGIFSPDNTIFFVGTTGDNQLHLISTQTLTDTRQINPGLTDSNGNPVPPIFLAVKPRPTT